MQTANHANLRELRRTEPALSIRVDSRDSRLILLLFMRGFKTTRLDSRRAGCRASSIVTFLA